MERPNVVLGILLATTTGIAGLVAASLALSGALGPTGVAFAARGATSVCDAVLLEAGRVPIAAALVAAVSFVALGRTLLRWKRERSVLRALPLEPASDPGLVAAAKRANAWPLYVLPARRPAAFCFGEIRTRVVLSAGLLERLDADERDAVLWHEGHHARSRAPLKMLAARIAAGSLFWVPLLPALRDRYLLLSELAADHAAREGASVGALARALRKAAPELPPRGAIGLADAAAARAARMLDPSSRLPPLLRPWAAAVSAAALASLGLLTLAPAGCRFIGAAMQAAAATLPPHQIAAAVTIALGSVIALCGATWATRRLQMPPTHD